MTSRRGLILLPAILAMLMLVPVSASAAEEPTTFTDTPGTSSESAVAALAEQGIARGCRPELFCAGDALSRGQAATLLVAALEVPGGDAGHFNDTGGSTHAPAIDALASAELITGCGDGSFCPQNAITREQFATMLHRALDVPEATDGVRYFDDVGGAHAAGVRALAESGIASGCGQRLTSFCVGDEVTRAHAAMFLARALGLVDPVQLPPFEERKAEQAEAEAKLAPRPPTPAETAVDVARQQLGKPYKWGGSGPHSFDCSGLTSFAWAKAGVSLPHSSRAQYSATSRVSRSDLRPGDLVFYHSPISHVAMYIGDGRVIEAPNRGNNVRIRQDGLTRRGVVGFGRP